MEGKTEQSRKIKQSIKKGVAGREDIKWGGNFLKKEKWTTPQKVKTFWGVLHHGGGELGGGVVLKIPTRKKKSNEASAQKRKGSVDKKGPIGKQIHTKKKKRKGIPG